MGMMAMAARPNCDDIAVGTMPFLHDVVKEGIVRGQFAEAMESSFKQSQQHSFYISGSTGMRADPVVYAVDSEDSAVDMQAYTQIERRGDTVRVQVRYSQELCDSEYAHMKMDL